jgi:LmbE family N-acetylglucosaminyl deacetylase
MRFVRIFLPLFLAAVPMSVRLAGQPAPVGEIELGLRKLNETGTVLMIAAHPDDERTNVLTLFARGRHMRTAYLSLTRGEGGQNLIGSEQGAALGIIRTQELLAARRIDGAEQFFSRAIDFGFTKTVPETMEKWGHDRVLSDVVWVIRRYRPDVVILGFSGTPADGHGQHQASAILGKEAFEAAGDAAKFPDQLKFVQVWKPAKLVFAGGFGGGRGPQGANPQAGRGGGRGGRGGGRGGPASATAAPEAAPAPPPPPIAPAAPVATSGYSPFLGYTFDQLASISRSQHRSQGFGNIGNGPAGNGPARGGAPAPAAAAPAPPPPPPNYVDLFADIDHSWGRFPGGAAIGAVLGRAVREFDPEHPEKTIPTLGEARPLIAAVTDPIGKIKLAELDELVAKCAGLWVEAQTREAEVVPGSKVTVAAAVYSRLSVPVAFQSARAEGVFSGPTVTKLADRPGGGFAGNLELQIPADQPYSQPYWLAKAPVGERYTVEDQMLAGLPESPVETVRFGLTVGGVPVEISRAIEHRSADRAEVERIRPLTIVPPVAVNMAGLVAVFPGVASKTVRLSVKANQAKAEGTVRLELPTGWKSVPASRPFQLAAVGEERELAFEITPPASASTGKLRAVATVGGREVSVGQTTLKFPHIPVEVQFPPAELKLVRADIQVTAKKVGYIMGAGDEVPASIRQMGATVEMISDADLVKGDLSRFDAIVAGVRAYNVRPDLRASHERLMEYVRQGGTYVVQYQSAGAEAANIGPYKISIAQGNGYRVTVEEAPVSFTHPDSRLLQYPNHITPKDFEGWVQERALLFPTEWDPKYETVLSSNDPGEKPLEGGELWTHYGKGVYIFSSYVWFRQLPAGVPGAYRLFANMLSAK